MWKCPKCETSNTDEAVKCVVCFEQRVNEPVVINTSQNNGNNGVRHKWIRPLAAIFVVLLSVALIFALVQNNRNKDRVTSQKDKTLAEEISILQKPFELNVTESKQLSYRVLPEETRNDMEVTWESSDNRIAMVDEAGIVTALKKGECKIIISIDELSISDSITMEVVPQMISVPSFSGMKYSQAKKKAKLFGFKLVKKERYSEKAKGIVLGQSIKKGSKKEEGSKIVLSVSKGIEYIYWTSSNYDRSILNAFGCFYNGESGIWEFARTKHGITSVTCNGISLDVFHIYDYGQQYDYENGAYWCLNSKPTSLINKNVTLRLYEGRKKCYVITYFSDGNNWSLW